MAAKSPRSPLPSPEGIIVEAGAHVWFQHPTEMWQPCTVAKGCRSKFEEVTLVDGATGATFTTPTTKLLHMHASSLKPVRDMVRLGDLNEAAILHNLRARYSTDLIYTFIGPILVSVNPYRRLPIYDDSEIQRYHRGAGAELELEPHIYGVTAQAYRGVLSGAGQNQSLVIGGESGAGKTEATKLAVKFLATVGAVGGGGGGDAGAAGPEQLLLDSSPIMEAFGNAKTVRNDNSSRFGKYMEIQFDRNGKIRGGKVTKYLLEKSRIVRQSPGERNFHILFMVFRLNASVRQQLWLQAEGDDAEAWKQVQTDLSHGAQPAAMDSFGYFSGGAEVAGWDDEEELGHTKRAMTTVGMSAAQQLSVWQVVASVLWLGNIGFSESEDGAGTLCSAVAAGGGMALERAARLLEVDGDALALCCTQRAMASREGVIVIPLSASQACDARDGLAKVLYSALFDWLIERIDTAMRPKDGDRSIGVLDIFGFEIFELNSFEQLCINLANEKLQFHFNAHVFSLELAVYNKEGLDVAAITFRDNAPCLQLIEGPRTGILALIDDEVAMPKGSDDALLRKFADAHRRHPCYAVRRPGGGGKGKARSSVQTFVVKHYAGDVAYSTDGFLEKNKDRVPDDVLSLLTSSTQPIIKQCFGESVGRKAGGGRPVTLGGQFKRSLAALYATLEATSPHFVKCIKPNDVKQNVFHAEFTLFQLQYLGLLEVIRIRKAGFPVRVPIKRFMGRYAALAPDATDVTEVAFMAGTEGEWQVGHTMVFMKDSMHEHLEDARSKMVAKVIPALQAFFRHELRRRAWTNKRRGVTALQARVRGTFGRVEGRSALSCLRAIKARDLPSLEAAEKEVEAALVALAGSGGCGRPDLLPPLLREVRALIDRLLDEEEAVAALLDAMESHDAQALEKAVASARQMKLKLPLLGRAQRTLSVLRESADVLTALQQAMRAPRGSVRMTALLTALATAEMRGLDGAEGEALPEVTEAKQMLAMSRLETAIMKRRETQPLGTLGGAGQPPPPLPVAVTFAEAGSLGISLKANETTGDIELLRVTPGTQAERHRQLRPGLILQTVSGAPVRGKEYRSVLAMIKASGRPLDMKFTSRGSQRADAEAPTPGERAHPLGWQHLPVGLQQLGNSVGGDRTAMRAAFSAACAATRPPPESEAWAILNAAKEAKGLRGGTGARPQVAEAARTARSAQAVPVHVDAAQEAFIASTRADSAVSRLVSKLRLSAGAYAVFLEPAGVGEAAVALTDETPLIEGLLGPESDDREISEKKREGRLVFGRRLMLKDAMTTANSADIAQIYARTANALAIGELRPTDVGDVVMLLALRLRIEGGAALDRRQLSSWLAPSEARKLCPSWSPTVWAAETAAVHQAVCGSDWGVLACQRHFLRLAETAREFGQSLFGVAVTAHAKNRTAVAENAVVRLGVGFSGLTLFPLAVGPLSVAARRLLGGSASTHRALSFDVIAQWTLSHALQIEFEADFVEEAGLRSLTIHGRSRRELAEMVELLNAYRAKYRKRRRRKKHSGTQ